MMKRRLRLIGLSLVFVVSTTVIGKPRTDLPRGGMGVLFPDHNSLENPGQLAQTNGTAAQIQYARVNSSNTEYLTPSLSWSGKGCALAAQIGRAGKISSAADSGDTATLGGGLSFGKQRFSLGAFYGRSLDGSVSGSGTAGAVITLQDPKKSGPSLGVKGSSTLGTSSNTIATSVALGYSFKANNSVEGVIELPDTKSTTDYIVSGFLNFGFRVFYLSLGDTYYKSTAIHLVKGRAGAVIGSSFDFSVLAEHTFRTGANPLIGGTFRASF